MVERASRHNSAPYPASGAWTPDQPAGNRRFHRFAQARPDAEPAQQLCAVLGEGDFAPVEGGVLQGSPGLLFEQAQAQAAAAQGARQAQASRPRSDEDEVKVHGEAA